MSSTIVNCPTKRERERERAIDCQNEIVGRKSVYRDISK